MKLEKLDRRHTGHEIFKYRVWMNGPQQDRITEFLTLREWCWDTWGAACERDIERNFPFNPVWSWHHDENAAWGNLYIYLSDDAALSMFKLKWM